MQKQIEISGITVIDDDGNITERGKALMEAVHEASGLGCWHRDVKPKEGYYWSGVGNVYCSKCDASACLPVPEKYNETNNPDYLTSLDAYRPVWEGMLVMSDDRVWRYEQALYGRQHDVLIGFTLLKLSQPHHHLEALARTLMVECGTCAGTGEPPCSKCTDKICKTGEPSGHEGICSKCPTCKGEGKVSVLAKWVGQG